MVIAEVVVVQVRLLIEILAGNRRLQVKAPSPEGFSLATESPNGSVLSQLHTSCWAWLGASLGRIEMIGVDEIHLLRRRPDGYELNRIGHHVAVGLVGERVLLDDARLKVPSRFHCPPPACWLTATRRGAPVVVDGVGGVGARLAWAVHLA